MRRRTVVFGMIACLAIGTLEGCVSLRTVAAWRAQRQELLAAGSTIADSPLGPIEYALVGSGPVILGLHGTMNGYDTGLAIYHALNARGVRLLSVSRPGYLRTPVSVGRTPAEEADAYVGLLDRLGIRRVAVLGASGGGPAALEFAIRHPDRCWGLILVSAIIEQQGMQHFSWFQRWMYQRSISDRQSYKTERLLQTDPARVVAVMAPETATAMRRDPELARLAVPLIETTFPMSLRSAGTLNDLAGTTPISRAELAGITVPTLILHGALDKWAPVKTARMAAATIPDARIVVYPNGDHLFFLVNAAQVTADLQGFIDAHAPR